jgi:pyruvate dehydrogenase E2 component (dihydrolipoamide acetyltransferase)
LFLISAFSEARTWPTQPVNPNIMALAVNMPQIGQDITKGVIRKWYVSEGDRVEKEDILATVESEKAAFEVEAPGSGTLIKILYQAGQEAGVFTPIAYIGDPGEKVPDAAHHEPAAGDAAIPEADSERPSATDAAHHKIFASPAVKRMAREHHIPLEEVMGTGPAGRIIKRDLLPYLAAGDDRQMDGQDPSGDRVIPLSPARQRMASRMVQSKQHIPHFYLSRHIDVTAMLAMRERHNETHPEKVSINDMIVFAVAGSLKEYPKLNAHVQDHQIILKGNINIGMAVIVEDGLLVPVIPEADRKNLAEISRYSKEIIQKAKRGIMQGGPPGTFTISNLGMYGISEFQAIINPPECAILSVGNVAKRALPGEQGVRFADFISFGLACDHRVIDGAYGAGFLESLAQKLETLNS